MNNNVIYFYLTKEALRGLYFNKIDKRAIETKYLTSCIQQKQPLKKLKEVVNNTANKRRHRLKNLM